MKNFYKQTSFSIFSRFLLAVVLVVGVAGSGWGQITVHSSDFNDSQGESFSTTGEIGNSGWLVSRSGDDWGARIHNNILELTNTASSASNANGWVFAYRETTDFDVPYNTQLDQNTGIVSWYFNMRQIRSNPAGFTSGSYGAAFVIGATSNSVAESGDGYAIVLGNTSTPDPIRFVKFSEGVQSIGASTGGLITSIAPLDNPTNNYMSLKITYNPSDDLWTLYGRNDGTAAFEDPLTGELTILGSVTNNDYTGTSLDYLGAYWQGATAGTQTAFFDNVSIQISETTPPSISNITQTPAADITSNDEVSVSADVEEGDAAIDKVELHWNTDNDFDSFTTIAMSASRNGETYTTDTDVPEQADGTTVYYRIYAEDTDDETATSAVQSYTVNDPVSLPYSEDFSDCTTQQWFAVSVASNRDWTCGSGYQSINGFGGDEPSDDYLISPLFNFEHTEDEIMTFSSWTRFNDLPHPRISLLYTTAYTGDPTTTSWNTELSPTWSPADSQEWTNSGEIDISGISGDKVRFAFHYTSSGTGGGSTSEWRIDDIQIFEATTPMITVAPETLSGFTYVEGDGPSAEQQFTITGENLTNDVTVTPPANYEISTATGGSFVATNPINLTPDGSDEVDATIYVRLKAGLPVGDYSDEDITINSDDFDAETVTCNGNVSEPVDPFEIPYTNDFRSQEDVDIALAQGFSLNNYEIHETSDPYFRFITTGSYIITPEIDFPAYDYLSTSFDLRNFGTGSGRELSIMVSDDGNDWTTIESISLNSTDFITEEVIINLTGDFNVETGWIRYEMTGGTGSIRFRDLSIVEYIPPAVPDPVFDLAAGTYFENQTVFIDNFDDYEVTASIYYTLNGQDPTDADALYDHTEGILLEDGNGPVTLKAIAIDNGSESDITSAVYIFPENVENIQALRAKPAGATLYRLNNQATLIGQDGFRNTKFFQDDSGFGIQIDDDPGNITSVYSIGDNVGSLVGTRNDFQGQIRFRPAIDPGAAVSSGNEITPLERTLTTLTQDDQSRLVVVYNVEFEDGDGIETFGGGGSTTSITDASIEGFAASFRNVFGDSDITGSTIPEGPVNITGVIQENNAGLNLAARNLDDFAQDDGTITNLNNGIQYATLQHAVDAASPGDKIKFVGEFEDLDASDSGVILAPGTSTGCAIFTDTYTLSSTETLEIEINGLLPCDEYDRITVGSTANLGNASLEVILGYAPDMNDEFTILISGTLVGMFAEGLETTAIFGSNEYTFAISYDDDEVVLTVTGIESIVAIPIAPWAIFLPVIMMLAFVVRRLRKKTA